MYIFNDHDKEAKFNSKSLLRVGGASNKISRDIGAHNFNNGALDILISNSLDVSVLDLLVPDLERFGSKLGISKVGRYVQGFNYPML